MNALYKCIGVDAYCHHVEDEDIGLDSSEPAPGLSPKQQRYVDEYMICLQPTRAARNAGYSKPNVAAFKLMAKPAVRDAIKARGQELTDRYAMTHERIVAEYARIVESDITEVAKWNSLGIRLEDSETLPADISAAVMEVSMGPNGPKVKMHAKADALQALAKIRGMFGPSANALGDLPADTVIIIGKDGAQH